MDGLVNWRALEKMTGWATRTGEEQIEMWDRGAANWNRRIEFEKEFTQRQVDAMDLRPEDTVLDACCGTGRVTIPMARKVKKVTALDAGTHMLEYCRDNARKAGLTNVETLQLNWHKATPGVDFPKHDVVVACISPAQADIVKLSSAATRYCYYLSFSKPIAFRHVMAELFEGCSEQWDRVAKESREENPRLLGMNVPFNILYDLGANPTLTYADGGWEYEGADREEIYAFLAGFGQIQPGKEEVFRANADKRIITLDNGRVRYVTRTQMFVLGWDPNELKL